jgi:hypothetical protein
MKTIVASGFILIGSCLLAAPEAKDIIRDRSPDGKFALRITKDDMGGSAAIIDLKGKGEVATLEVYQNYTEQARLVWSKDSQRVAYFEPDRRGGSTTIYFRNGDKFEDVDLPELPECRIEAAEGDTHVKTVETTIAPQKWLSSGALVLRLHSGELMESGDSQREKSCTQIVTIAFDSSHKASVETVKKSDHE